MTPVAKWLAVSLGLGLWQVVVAQAPEPLLSRYAQTRTAFGVDFMVHYFNAARAQEADQFDGFSAGLEATIPITSRFQLWFILPFYTDGEARLVENGEAVDIDGYGGTLDFPALVHEYQVLEEASGWRPNLAFGFGAGKALAELDARVDGELVDRYNHSGSKFIFSVKADKSLRDRSLTAIGNLSFHYFIRSDDINPAGDNSVDEFTLMDLTAAAVFNRLHSSLYPALELTYQTTFGAGGDYDALSLTPELLYSNGAWDAKLGVPLRLAGDGQRYGARLEFSYRF